MSLGGFSIVNAGLPAFHPTRAQQNRTIADASAVEA